MALPSEWAMDWGAVMRLVADGNAAVLQLLRAGHVSECDPGAVDHEGTSGSAQERVPAHGPRVLTQGDEIFVAHTGDSRAVLVHRSGKVSVLTSDHKPNRPDERRRIQELGGSVVFWGVWRVEGILAVSRAIGDRMLKPFVVAEPEVKKFTRTETDRYVVLASDGVWDTVSNDDAAQLVLKYEDPQAAAQRIMEEAYARGSMDNICVMVIDLRA
ncbi:unnamed protein product [Phytophthora lilii]|uniref:Unnamed protein product n=1 Tax=Phytophthora lilii TaxID=2077276 RepID=A0A9W6UAF9_9STRA|nr:unnamed protein product [Phytophthora lilii]